MATALQNLNFIISLTDRMSAPMGKITKSLDTVQKKMSSGGMKVGIGTAGLYAVGYAIDKLTGKSIAFESAMADVRKVTNFPTPDGLKQFGDELLKLSHTIPITAEGLAQIATAGGQLGIAEKDLIGFTQIVAKMSTAFDMMPQDAGEAIAKLSNIFHIPIKDMERVGDAINTLDNNMAAKSRDIVDVLARIGGTSQLLGLTANQAGALSAAMLSLGQTPELAGTSINALLLRLGTARNQSKDFIGALGDIGLSVDQLEANLKSGGAQATINDFLARLSKLDKAAQLNTLGQLFGAEYSDNLGILVGGLDQYQKALGLVNDQSKFQGSMQNEFNIRSATTANHLKTLQNLWDHLLINAGTIFLPMVNAGIEQMNGLLEPLVNSIGKWAAEYPLLTKVIGYAAAALFTFVAAVAITSIAMGTFSLMAGGFGAVMAVITSPITLTILAIAAMGAAVYFAVTRWQQLKQAIFDLAGNFLTTIGVFGFVDTVLAKWDALKAWWNGFDLFMAALRPFEMLVGGGILAVDAALAVFERLKGWWSGFKGFLSSLDPFGGLMSGVNAVIAKVQSIGSALKMSVPAVSVGAGSSSGGGSAPRDIIGQLQGKIGNSNTSNKSVTVNVHNQGGSVSPAAIAHHLQMAGG